MSAWTAIWLLAAGYVVLVSLYLAASWFYGANASHLEGDESNDRDVALSAARARGRDDAERHGGVDRDVPPVPADHIRHPDARDETIGRDQCRPKARRRIRELQPLTLRQREALKRVSRGE